MKKTLGIFAHVDAGKTTFSEQVLFHTQAIRNLGRVDHKNAFLDTHDIEKARGITIFSEQAHFKYKEDHYYLIDTPGHVDFSAEMERAIEIIDYAVIVISAIDGIQSHTETVYELLKEKNKGIFFFINKIDSQYATPDQAVKEIKGMCPGAVILDEDLETLLEYDDELLEAYFEGHVDEDALEALTISLISQSCIAPIFKGSALKDIGIDEFIEALHRLSQVTYQEALTGVCYKVRYDLKGVRQCFVKVTGGTLKVRDTVKGYKITEIRQYQGQKYEVLNQAEAGDLVALVGVDLNVGDTLSEDRVSYKMQATLQSKVIFDPSISPKDMYQVFLKLEDEDPTLKVQYNTLHHEIIIGIMGTIQLEILESVLKNRFSYEVSFEDPTIVYEETITDTVIGYGHFEPLKHYAEVHLKLEPNPGKGIEFVNACSTDDLSVGHQNLVKHHIFEKRHNGILTGSHLTDLKITLLTGRGHNKHTHGGDFREATLRALRQGLEQATSVLLEPIYHAKITVDKEDMGRVLTDITKANGTCIGQEQNGESIIIYAEVPVKTFKDYGVTLASLTSGKGRLQLRVKSYKPCHNQEEIVESIAYDKVTDKAYPSSSVFCSKGKGYTVDWTEAKSYMHCI